MLSSAARQSAARRCAQSASGRAKNAISTGNGKARLVTVSGGILIATMSGPSIVVTDEKGSSGKVTIGDVFQSNGVIHVVDKVLLPK